MSSHPARYYGTNNLHFITCSCYHRQPWLASPQRRDLFLAVFEEVRQRYSLVVVGYVAMPDHIHLLARGLVQEPEQWPWSSYRSYAFGEEGAVRINQWGEAKLKIPTQAA